MKRRDFVKTVGLKALATISFSARTGFAVQGTTTTGHYKQWAKEHCKGMENLFFLPARRI
jgi:hypothetical protein